MIAKYYLTNIKGLNDRFIIFDDDTFLGRYAPSVFLTQFGGNNLYVEDSLVDDCPCTSSQYGHAVFVILCERYDEYMDLDLFHFIT